MKTRDLPGNALVLPKIISSLLILDFTLNCLRMSTKHIVKTHQVTLLNRALSQTGELDQPMVHPILFPRSSAFRQGTFCQIWLSGVGVTFDQPQKERLAYKLVGGNKTMLINGFNFEFRRRVFHFMNLLKQLKHVLMHFF